MLNKDELSLPNSPPWIPSGSRNFLQSQTTTSCPPEAQRRGYISLIHDNSPSLKS